MLKKTTKHPCASKAQRRAKEIFQRPNLVGLVWWQSGWRVEFIPRTMNASRPRGHGQLVYTADPPLG